MQETQQFFHMSDGHALAFIAALKAEAEREGHDKPVTYTVADGQKLTCTWNPPMKYGRPDLKHVSAPLFLHEWLINGDYADESEVLDLLTGRESAAKPDGAALFASIASRSAREGFPL